MKNSHPATPLDFSDACDVRKPLDIGRATWKSYWKLLIWVEGTRRPQLTYNLNNKGHAAVLTLESDIRHNKTEIRNLKSETRSPNLEKKSVPPFVSERRIITKSDSFYFIPLHLNVTPWPFEASIPDTRIHPNFGSASTWSRPGDFAIITLELNNLKKSS